MKLKKSQRANWGLFFNHAIESFANSQFIGIPFGKSGYGLIGNPFDPAILEFLISNFQSDLSSQVVFLTNDPEFFSPIIRTDLKLMQVAETIWPNDLIIRIPPADSVQLIHNQLYQIPDQLWDHFKENKLNLIIPNHDIIQDFFKELSSRQIPPLLIGFYIDFGDNVPCVNVEELIEFPNPEVLGVILSGGKIQKGKALLPATIIELTELDELEIIQSGLIRETQIFPNLNGDIDFN